MAIGYRPVCQSQPGLWPCYPIKPRFGLMGLGGSINPVIPRYGVAGVGMLTGRFTYGLGQVSSDPFIEGLIDPSAGWISGIPNFVPLAVGGLALFFLISGGKRGYGAVKSATGKVSSKRKKAREIRREYEDLPWYAKI